MQKNAERNGLKLMKHKLTKLKSNHNNLRTDEVIGNVFFPPAVGSSLVMFSEPLDKTASIRSIQTSTIQEIYELSPGVIEFKTRNSNYRLEKL